MNDFIICGHRGDPVNYAENTMDSFISAASSGANALETDLCITKDGTIVLWHDWSPNSLEANLREFGFEGNKFVPFNNSGLNVNLLSYNEFTTYCGYSRKLDAKVPGTRIPTLSDLFKFLLKYEGIKYVFFDIKVPKFRPYEYSLIIKAIRRNIDALNLPVEFIIESFHRNFLDEKFGARVNRGLDVAAPAGIIFTAKKYSAMVPVCNRDYEYVVSMKPTVATFRNWWTYKRIIRYDIKLKKKLKIGAQIISATINDEREMKWLINAGVRGIQTDNVSKLSKIVMDKKWKEM